MKIKAKKKTWFKIKLNVSSEKPGLQARDPSPVRATAPHQLPGALPAGDEEEDEDTRHQPAHGALQL